MLNGWRCTWALRMAADGMAEAEARTRRDEPMVVEADGQGREGSRGVGVVMTHEKENDAHRLGGYNLILV
jgi:hypothetical protein